jgi:hypothetical protein
MTFTTRLFAATFIAAIIAPLAGRADTTGVLIGRISDADTAAPIADALVTAASPTERETRRSDAKGFYSFIDLAPGIYYMTVQAAHYEPASVPGAVVHAGASLSLNLEMRKMLRTVVIDCFCPQPLMLPARGADEYRIKSWNAPSFNFVDYAGSLLWMAPGLTFGNAPRMMR